MPTITTPSNTQAEQAIASLVKEYGLSTVLGSMASYCALQSVQVKSGQTKWSTASNLITDAMTKIGIIGLH